MSGAAARLRVRVSLLVFLLVLLLGASLFLGGGTRPSLMPTGLHGCFGGQPRNDAEAAAVRATFRLGWGGHHFGTGFALRGADGGSILLTASHLVGPGGRVEAVAPDGQRLGTLVGVRAGRMEAVPGSGGALLGDVTVLEPDGTWDPSGAVLPMNTAARPAGDGAVFVRFASPGGPDIGSSGAPVANGAGEFVGLLTHSNSPPFPRRLLVGYGGSVVHRTIPLAGWGFADTLAAPASSAVTGDSIRPSRSDDAPSSGIAIVPAYPWGHCVLSRGSWAAYSGNMREAADRALAELAVNRSGINRKPFP